MFLILSRKHFSLIRTTDLFMTLGQFQTKQQLSLILSIWSLNFLINVVDLKEWKGSHTYERASLAQLTQIGFLKTVQLTS